MAQEKYNKTWAKGGESNYQKLVSKDNNKINNYCEADNIMQSVQ